MTQEWQARHDLEEISSGNQVARPIETSDTVETNHKQAKKLLSHHKSRKGMRGSSQKQTEA